MDYTVMYNMRLPQLTLGTVQLGLAYGIANVIGKPDESNSTELLRFAEQQGINCFDTASGYGDSEIVLGNFFKKHPNAERQIVTKFKLDGEVASTEQELEKTIRLQLEQSLIRLGVKRIPIYLLHQADDLHRHQKRIVAVLDRLIREGLIGMAGVSVYTSADLDCMLRYDLFQATQIPINIVDQRLIKSGHIERLRANHIIVFARSIYLQGLFFMSPENLPSNLTLAAPWIRQLQQMAINEHMSIAQMALSYVRDLPGITSLVIGSETIEQLAENVRLIEGPPVSDTGREFAEKKFRDVPEIMLNPSLWKR